MNLWSQCTLRSVGFDKTKLAAEIIILSPLDPLIPTGETNK